MNPSPGSWKKLALEHQYPPMEVPFGVGEYRARLDRIRARMAQDGIACLYLTAPESLCYVCGYQAEWYQAQSPKAWAAVSGIAVHVDHDRFILFDTEEELVLARTQTVATDIRLLPPTDGVDAIRWIVNELKAEGWLTGPVGLEHWSYRPNPAINRRLQAAFADRTVTVVDGSDVLRDVRWLKSPAEIACIRQAGRYAEVGLEAAARAIRPGVSELDVYAEMVHALAKAGSETPGITMPVLSGAKQVCPHALASRKRIVAGEPVFVDVCGVHNRYHANMARTFWVGEPPADAVKVADLSVEGTLMIRAMLRPGLPVRELTLAARNFFREAGIWEDRMWVGGYEMGIAFPPDWVGSFVYDPDLSDDGAVFAPGAAVNWESNFYLPRLLGFFALIDTFVFTEDLAEGLGTLPMAIRAVG